MSSNLEKSLSFHLPKVEIDKNKFTYHEVAEVFFREDILDMYENKYIMYVEGINIAEEVKNCPVLVGFTGIRNVKKLFGNIKIEKDSIFIPLKIIRNYTPLNKK